MVHDVSTSLTWLSHILNFKMFKIRSCSLQNETAALYGDEYARVTNMSSLYCLDSAQPLSCLGSSVVEHLPSKQCVVGLSPA